MLVSPRSALESNPTHLITPGWVHRVVKLAPDAGAAAVVKLQVKSAARGLPAVSVTPAATVAVYCVLVARAADGVKVAVLPLTLTVPVTAAPPGVVTSVKLAVFSVELVIGSENVADTEEFVDTLPAAFAGDVVDTVGGTLSGVAEVVVVGEVAPAGANNDGCAPPPPAPPQPNRPILANSVTEKCPQRFPI